MFWRFAFGKLTLWCCVSRRTALSVQEISIVKAIAETKIDDRQIVVLVEHEVLQFDVTVNNFGLVHVIDRRTDLPDVLSRLVLVKATPANCMIVSSIQLRLQV